MGVTAERDVGCDRAVYSFEECEADGAVVGSVVCLKRFVDAEKDVGRRVHVSCRRACGVSGDRCQSGRFDSLAGDVADRQRPTIVADFEQVVEVATDFGAFLARPVATFSVEPFRGRQVGRQQASLQRHSDRALLLVETCPLQCPGASTSDGAQQIHLCVGDCMGVAPGDEQSPDHSSSEQQREHDDGSVIDGAVAHVGVTGVDLASSRENDRRSVAHGVRYRRLVGCGEHVPGAQFCRVVSHLSCDSERT